VCNFPLPILMQEELEEPLQLQAAVLRATSRHQEHLERGRRLAAEVEALTERASRLTVRLAELAEQERVWAERVQEEGADSGTPEVA
jgi:hypothetical protein